jgi:hypothetical protein
MVESSATSVIEADHVLRPVAQDEGLGRGLVVASGR